MTPEDVAVPAEPLAELDYIAHSASAGVPTRYVMAVFLTELSAEVRPAVDGCPENRWVTRAEARAGLTSDGVGVSPSVETILSQLGM